MAAWMDTLAGNWKTSLAATLASTAEVVVGPTSNVDPDTLPCKVIVCFPDRNWTPSESPSGCRCYDVRGVFGCVIRGMDDAESVGDLWDALDLLEDAIVAALAPSTGFRSANKIDELVSLKATVAAARVGQIELTLRVRRD